MDSRIRPILFVGAIVLMCFAPSSLSIASEDRSLSLGGLIERLLQDGFDRELLSKIFLDPRAAPSSRLMTVHIGSKEVPERYHRFLAPESVFLARSFLQKNLKTLREMEKRFPVAKEVVIAILLIESRFGANTGRFRVIPTLASMAIMDAPAIMESTYSTLYVLDPEISYDRVERVSRRKAAWGYEELKCFMEIIGQEPLDPLEIRGSHAGAMGMAQFIPSSYLAFALPSEGFENWLLNEKDAIYSVANYLESHGWEKNLSMRSKKNVLWYYNRSQPYIDTVLAVARRLKGEPPSSPKGRGKASSN